LPGLDVFALTSRYEGLALVLLEAMASGVPLIGSDVPGITDVIAHGDTGLLVAPGDAAGFATAIGRVLDEPGLADRLRGNGASALPRFDSRAAIVRIESVYERVLEPRRAARQVGAG